MLVSNCFMQAMMSALVTASLGSITLGVVGAGGSSLGASTFGVSGAEGVSATVSTDVPGVVASN